MSKSTELLLAGIREGVFPGAACAVAQRGWVELDCAGRFTYCPESPEVNSHTLWDLASVSKVIGTTTMAMQLFEQGALDLDAPVSETLPEFGQNSKQAITARDLLTHRSGLRAFRGMHREFVDPELARQAVMAESLSYETGTRATYSDLGMITLQMLLERLAGESQDQFLARGAFAGLSRTLYNPPRELAKECAPTEPVEPWRVRCRAFQNRRAPLTGLPDREFWVQGEVHDPNAMVLGGVAGHAGLFSSLEDMAKVGAALMQRQFAGISEATWREWTRRQHADATRALGWDTRSSDSPWSGSRFGPVSFGHSGYTGTSIWVDPERERFVVLLTNRVHPTSANNKLGAFRPRFHDAVLAD